MSNIAQNIDSVLQNISQIVATTKRNAHSIQLMAVSKTKPASAVREAFATGLVDFGENYLQEALQKQIELKDIPLVWHFIGPIQSNKTKEIAAHFDWVHSVDRLKIAERLSNQRPTHLPPLQICIQVNISDEDTKSGCIPAAVSELVAAIIKLPNLTLRGLMAIPEPTDDKAKQHQSFSKLRMLKDSLNSQFGLSLDTLSMGMSDDLEAAIIEGSTWVRVGSAIFGARTYKS